MLDHKQKMCTIHPDKSLELFCKKEECLICLGCAVVNHHQHQYDFISQIAEQYKKEIKNALSAFRTQLQCIQQAATEVKHMQQQIEVRNKENASHINEVFQEIIVSLNKRKQEMLNDINKTTATKLKVLNEQYNELLNLSTQMNNYLELIESKLRSERDRAIVAIKWLIVVIHC